MIRTLFVRPRRARAGALALGLSLLAATAFAAPLSDHDEDLIAYANEALAGIAIDPRLVGDVAPYLSIAVANAAVEIGEAVVAAKRHLKDIKDQSHPKVAKLSARLDALSEHHAHLETLQKRFKEAARADKDRLRAFSDKYRPHMDTIRGFLVTLFPDDLRHVRGAAMGAFTKEPRALFDLLWRLNADCRGELAGIANGDVSQPDRVDVVPAVWCEAARDPKAKLVEAVRAAIHADLAHARGALEAVTAKDLERVDGELDKLERRSASSLYFDYRAMIEDAKKRFGEAFEVFGVPWSDDVFGEVATAYAAFHERVTEAATSRWRYRPADGGKKTALSKLRGVRADLVARAKKKGWGAPKILAAHSTWEWHIANKQSGVPISKSRRGSALVRRAGEPYCRQIEWSISMPWTGKRYGKASAGAAGSDLTTSRIVSCNP